MLKKIKKALRNKQTKTTNAQKEPIIVPREAHTISRKMISGYALRVMKELHQAGFDAYLVGGCVRDLLLNQHPKDFDVATNAKPSEVKRLFRNCYLVGKRFRLAHVRFGNEIIEVATYRRAVSEEDNEDLQRHGEHGMILRDNVFGTLEEDAYRRDFTINALYYNFSDRSIVDYVDGMVDIASRTLRLIGSPETRFREDPLRMVRAIRFMSKLNCQLEPALAQGIHHYNHLLQHVPSARLFDEFMKIYRGGHAFATFKALREYGLLDLLFPHMLSSFKGKYAQIAKSFVDFALTNTDLRVQENKGLSPAFLFAAFLWWPLQEKLDSLLTNHKKFFVCFEEAMHQLIEEQLQHIAIPKRIIANIREIWFLQYQFPLRRAKRVYRCYYHPRFRAAYDFLLLRAEVDEEIKALAEWWTQFQHAEEQEREKMLKLIAHPPSKNKSGGK